MQIERVNKITIALKELYKNMQMAEDKHSTLMQSIAEIHQASAKNLIHYLTLRSFDIRDIQEALHEMALSSLTHSERNILPQIKKIIHWLESNTAAVQEDLVEQNQLLHNTKHLFGNKSNASIPYIMVTLDAQKATDKAYCKNLLLSGMQIARINCAHDHEKIWQIIIQNIKTACGETKLSCKIYMDLPGPKIRTVLPEYLLINNVKKIPVQKGDVLFIAEDPKKLNIDIPTIFCTTKGITTSLKKMDRIFFDDGVIEGFVNEVATDGASITITRVHSSKAAIKHMKGINFPDTQLSLSSLSKADIKHLQFIVKHADLVGYSFIRQPSDLDDLMLQLNLAGSKLPHWILKIETPQAVQQLPAILLKAMYWQMPFGVMIARGDLAVEIGFERLSEIQEEILWICEAAHVPVIWATQVLETLNKYGRATRSEITDAAHSAAAECVMINKGDFTLEVVESLKNVLERSAKHFIKKRYTFRALEIAQTFIYG